MRASLFFVNGRPSLAGWLVGGTGLLAAVVLVVLAVRSRHAPPPSAAPSAQSRSAPPDFEVRPASVEEGLAKWYDVPEGSLAQRRAWPGELTAASDRLPKDAYARVRRIDAHGDPDKSVVVRITDSVGGRGALIDLCREAAEELGMVKAGQARVRVEILTLKNATTDKPVEDKHGPPPSPKAGEITDRPAASQQQEKEAADAKDGGPRKP